MDPLPQPAFSRSAIAVLCGAVLLGGCAGEIQSPSSRLQPSYLGAAPAAASAQPAPAAHAPRVSTSKVLSAIVFERVTGLEVDPARLIER